MRVSLLRAAVLASAAAILAAGGPGSIRAGRQPSGCTSRWLVSDGGISPWRELRVDTDGVPLASLRTDAPNIESLQMGWSLLDFDGDGASDVFMTYTRPDGRIGWRVSYRGTSVWRELAASTTPARELQFGDFNGDGRTDVFIPVATAGDYRQWKYSPQGTGAFIDLRTDATPLSRLRMGDMDGDGTTDVVSLARSGDQWMWAVSKSGTEVPVPIGLAGAAPQAPRTMAWARGIAIILWSRPTATPGRYRWLTVGARRPLLVTTQPRPLSAIRFFADFDGDGIADFFFTRKRADGTYDWFITHMLTTTQQFQTNRLNRKRTNPSALRVGDFDGNGKADILTSVRTCP